MKIVVCDDSPSRGEDVMDHLAAVGQSAPTLLTGDGLTKALASLFDRIGAFRIPEESGARRWDFSGYKHRWSEFDDADLLLLDNNLTLLDNEGPPLTAESIAGYLRAFTHARYIVSLNMNPDVDFDLRYLVGDFLTRADLAINARHLENGYLWSGAPQDAREGFAPWYWPRLADIAEYRIRQIEFIQANYDRSVLDALGFDEESVHTLSRHAQGALSPEASPESHDAGNGRNLRDVTFREFFLAKNRALPVPDERDQLDAAFEQNGEIQKLVARIVAADIDLWLRRDVLGPQEPLVDVPHLTGRFPFLLGGVGNSLDGWNSVVRHPEAPFGLDPRMYDDHVNSHRFKQEGIWIQKACFWWSKLKDDEHLNAQLFAANGDAWPDVVFCEDVSEFRLRAGADGVPDPVEFVAEFEGVWNRRHIANLDGIQYAPRTRLAL
jgi:hypothetical protein